jgi:hypothetical protein
MIYQWPNVPKGKRSTKLNTFLPRRILSTLWHFDRQMTTVGELLKKNPEMVAKRYGFGAYSFKFLCRKLTNLQTPSGPRMNIDVVPQKSLALGEIYTQVTNFGPVPLRQAVRDYLDQELTRRGLLPNSWLAATIQKKVIARLSKSNRQVINTPTGSLEFDVEWASHGQEFTLYLKIKRRGKTNMGTNASFSYESEVDYIMRYFQQFLPSYKAMLKRKITLTAIFAAIEERLK